ncbi:ABC transporter substrate-binding protein [Aminithiophilus ramosus]|uniref:ABC transporter substrate-binding protein n=2 Tax=Synergistales TaxID=649776 RepID=A0A9Q7AD23_9BACT|nr:ABC transporter substrate-binding protein [Aminithiophilus ramosus]QTX32628.1 ABC transporter substrate-binding protein [Aminithiophilus ramosus]QVL36504.1 ABC transporter substrate-binding protein [Synergistota bacterium]
MKKYLLSFVTVVALFGVTCAGAAAAYKDEIVYCQGNDLTTMDISIGIQERACALTNNMFDSLFTFDEDMNVICDLAESYRWLDDTSLEVKIKKGITFHNGAAMTPEDVAFSMDHINERGSLFAGNYVGTDIVDDATVVIRLKAPNPPLVNLLAVPYAAVLPKDVYTADPKAFAQKPVGTGPYKLKEFKEGDYYTLERFDDYRGTPAKTKLLTLRIVPEAAQRLILLETGEVDVAYEIPASSVSRIEGDRNLKIITSDSMKIVTLNLNSGSSGPLGNRLVRKAIQSAIDKQIIIDAFLYGYGKAVNSTIPESAKEYAVQEDYRYDPEAAKKLLAEAGYPDGFKMTIWTDSNQTNTEISQVLQNQLSKVGIDLSIVVQDPNTTFSRLKAGDDFDMILDFFNLVSAHADQVYKRLLYSTSSSNWSNYKNPEYDAAYDLYAGTPEGERRDERRAAVNDFFIKDVPIIALYNETKIIGAAKTLEGFRTSRIGSHEYHEATIEK